MDRIEREYEIGIHAAQSRGDMWGAMELVVGLREYQDLYRETPWEDEIDDDTRNCRD